MVDSQPEGLNVYASSEQEKTIQLGDDENKVQEAASSEPEFPDGGLRAWLVVLGTICGSISTQVHLIVNALFSSIKCPSDSATLMHGVRVPLLQVFQAYYEETLLKDTPASNIAWIGSIQYSLVFLPGLITGRMFDLGYFKIPLFAASCLLVLSTFLVAECTEYWQFILCQGLATGIGCGTIFGPTLGVIGHWFKRKRGLAMGFTAMGSSIGGTIFPIATHKLIPLVGFPWTMRICGFMLIFTLSIANLTVARRLPPKNIKGGLLNLQAFRSAAFTVYCINGFVAFLGLYTVLTYIDVSAVAAGVSPDFSFYLVSIANGCSLFGRLAGGPLNVMIPMTLVAAGMTFAWPHAQTQTSLVVVAAVVSGVYVSTFALPVFPMGDVEDIGRRTGMALTVAAAGALAGPPISGAINTATGGFVAVGYYAGGTILLAVILMVMTRQLQLGRVWGKV
ncbi:MFS domain-containing protein [Mycena sanguinolenta]|uniref:MFS domain-containing protein n=1 Tax=Mycena sanguinolenta TaxID=230812 RepID=A0A8H6Z0G1_9AGAR|nr:MFS domain-containing protein [Mycena sanguinolenta]